ncbi:hypothetical protein [Microbacterium schleiferi]|jgi:hypothetical protein|uniref:Uncharacterized protein n=1 Tax=Microbacterium schleiferi TaxID=69362 RepID=A0ABU7V530_9MICO
MTGASPAPQAAAQPFTMLGGGGVVCEGDSCIIPGSVADDASTS